MRAADDRNFKPPQLWPRGFATDWCAEHPNNLKLRVKAMEAWRIEAWREAVRGEAHEPPPSMEPPPDA